MKQKIMFASSEASTGLQYDPKLVQSMFMQVITTGLTNNNRNNLKPHLTDELSDELLLEKTQYGLCTGNEAAAEDRGKQTDWKGAGR